MSCHQLSSRSFAYAQLNFATVFGAGFIGVPPVEGVVDDEMAITLQLMKRFVLSPFITSP